MNPKDWVERAETSVQSAHMLLDTDPDAACSRAYYAMFYAARAALLHAGQAQAAMAKTHAGVISAFGEHLVKSQLIDAEHGRSFAKVERERLVADYSGDGISGDAATIALKRADEFLSAVKHWMAQS